MPSHSTAQEPWHDLRDAYAAVGRRLEPGRGKPDQRQLQVVAEAPLPTTPVLWTDASATVVSAAIAARARVDVLSAGLGVVDQYFDDTRLRNVMRLSLGARSDLLAAAGEYCLALGAAPRASRFGTYASTFAQRPSQQYRAEAIIACSLALNGEYAAAKSHIEAAESIAPEEERAADESRYLLLNAVGFVAIGEGNAPALEAIAGDLATLRPDDPFWSYTAGALEVVHSVLVGEFPRAIAHSMELLHSTRRNRSHRMVRQFLLCVRSGMHIAFGEPGAAHALVSGQETPPMHGVCFHAQRALALLALGRSTDVIDETDGCVAEQEHALRTLVQVLICRAIAFARCGAMTQSARSIEDAFGLMAHTRDWTSPFTMMPLRDSAELLDRVARRRPDLATVVATIRTVLGAICAPARADEADGTLLLTEAEIAIAQSLVTGDGVREIAAARSVSVSTVKSQLRSIYRKLGVSTREAAVLRMASSEAFAGLRGADRQRRDR